MGGKKWKAMNSFGGAQRKANPRKPKGKDSRRGFIVTMAILLLILAAAWIGASRASAADFEIRVYSVFTETEQNFRVLLYANCTDDTGLVHEDNVTFTINTVDFEWNPWMTRYEGVALETLPTTEVYGALDSFTDANNVTSTAAVTVDATVTWTTGTLERLQTRFTVGDWIGAVFDEEAYLVGGLTLYTFVMLMFSVGLYNYSGVYATFLFWLLGWGVFAGLVHGPAQAIALLLFTLGLGITVAKLYLDRRTT